MAKKGKGLTQLEIAITPLPGSATTTASAATRRRVPLPENLQSDLNMILDRRGVELDRDFLTERQIEEREEVLTESGGSSGTTQVFGDEEGETFQTSKASVLFDFDTSYISDGFYQSLENKFIRPGAPGSRTGALAAVAGLQPARRSSVFIYRKTLISGVTVVSYDYGPVSASPKLKVEPRTRQIIYSEGEKKLLYRILNKDKINETQAREAIESYLNLAPQEEIESSIITNRIESKNKIKLSSL